jgi:geranylgeranyl reductase family protein
MREPRREIKRQVAVVGAGPSGSATAASLAAAGISVILIDKRQSGTEKPCAGGILERAVSRLPETRPDANLWQDGITRFALSCDLRAGFERRTWRPLVRTVLRARFDEWLAECARAAGAELLSGQAVTSVLVEDEHVMVETERTRLRAEVLVGADGASSLVARQCGMIGRLDLEPAFVMKVKPVDMRSFRHRAAIDWNTPPGGYSWVFPKGDHLSIGAVGPAAGCRDLAGYAGELMRRDVGESANLVSEVCACVPVPTSEIRRALRRVLLVGDAAALVDPFTREGISWALWSSQLAAEAVLVFLKGEAQSLLLYEELLERELLPELRAAGELAQWFYSNPSSAHRLLRDKLLVWHAFCRLLTGRMSHRDLLRKLPTHDAQVDCHSASMIRGA